MPALVNQFAEVLQMLLALPSAHAGHALTLVEEDHDPLVTRLADPLRKRTEYGQGRALIDPLQNAELPVDATVEALSGEPLAHGQERLFIMVGEGRYCSLHRACEADAFDCVEAVHIGQDLLLRLGWRQTLLPIAVDVR